jgi:hypothetical protein
MLSSMSFRLSGVQLESVVSLGLQVIECKALKHAVGLGHA